MIRDVANNTYTPGFTTSPDTYTVMFAISNSEFVFNESVAIVDDANGIVASGGGGGTRTTHQTPMTITRTPNADARMRLRPIH
jgi:hypothetical protein